MQASFFSALLLSFEYFVIPDWMSFFPVQFAPFPIPDDGTFIMTLCPCALK